MKKPRRKFVPFPETWHDVAIVEDEPQLDLFSLATSEDVEYNKSREAEDVRDDRKDLGWVADSNA